MNERIKELMTQATVEVRSHGAFGESERYNKLDPEKFAELIVRECADIANSHYECKVAGYPGDKIEEHFGVKE